MFFSSTSVTAHTEAVTAYIAAVTTHMATVTTHIAAVTSHIHNFEPTATSHEKAGAFFMIMFMIMRVIMIIGDITSNVQHSIISPVKSTCEPVTLIFLRKFPRPTYPVNYFCTNFIRPARGQNNQ